MERVLRARVVLLLLLLLLLLLELELEEDELVVGAAVTAALAGLCEEIGRAHV